MEETWKASEYATLVRHRHGANHLANSGTAHASIGWKTLMAQFHAEEAAKAETEHSPDLIKAVRNLLMSAANQPEAGPYRIVLFIAEAHLIACAQTLHSLGDIMASVVFTASGLPAWGLPESERSLSSVLKHLDGINGFKEISAPLRELQRAFSFRFVNAFVNITKHRRLIATHHRVSLSPNQKHGLIIEAFDYGRETFATQWAATLYNDYRTDIVKRVIKTGNAVNAWLAGDEA